MGNAFLRVIVVVLLATSGFSWLNGYEIWGVAWFGLAFVTAYFRKKMFPRPDDALAQAAEALEAGKYKSAREKASYAASNLQYPQRQCLAWTLCAIAETAPDEVEAAQASLLRAGFPSGNGPFDIQLRAMQTRISRGVTSDAKAFVAEALADYGS